MSHDSTLVQAIGKEPEKELKKEVKKPKTIFKRVKKGAKNVTT